MRREIGLAVELARSALESLESDSSEDIVMWMFGESEETYDGSEPTYDPLTIPQAIFGGSSEPVDVIGIANINGEIAAEDAKGGDVVSEEMDKLSMLRTESCVSKWG